MRMQKLWGLAALMAGLPIADSALRQIEALQLEKESRTPAQQKMDSQLIYAAKQSRHEAIASGVPLLQVAVEFAPDGRILVDIDLVDEEK